MFLEVDLIQNFDSLKICIYLFVWFYNFFLLFFSALFWRWYLYLDWLCMVFVYINVFFMVIYFLCPSFQVLFWVIINPLLYVANVYTILENLFKLVVFAVMLYKLMKIIIWSKKILLFLVKIENWKKVETYLKLTYQITWLNTLLWGIIPWINYY